MNKMIQRIACLALFAPALAIYAAAAPTPVLPVVQAGDSATQQPVKTITIHAKKYEFMPAEITLKKGETVKLELTSDDVRHSLEVKALGINGDMQKGKITDVTVTPEQTGDFKGKCGHFCGMGHDKMHFVVHVVNP